MVGLCVSSGYCVGFALDVFRFPARLVLGSCFLARFVLGETARCDECAVAVKAARCQTSNAAGACFDTRPAITRRMSGETILSGVLVDKGREDCRRYINVRFPWVHTCRYRRQVRRVLEIVGLGEARFEGVLTPDTR